MKIAFINGSPKKTGSASAMLIEEMTACLEDMETVQYHAYNGAFAIPEALKEQDAMVFVFPLYVDGVPSHLVRLLERLETTLHGKSISVYAVVNCGFFEGEQNRWALEIIHNWCVKAGLSWGRGLGIGGGGMLSMLKDAPPDKGPKKTISRGIDQLVHSIRENTHGQESAADLLVSPNFPRRLYMLAAQMGWRRQIKKNGLKAKDLGRKEGCIRLT